MPVGLGVSELYHSNCGYEVEDDGQKHRLIQDDENIVTRTSNDGHNQLQRKDILTLKKTASSKGEYISHFVTFSRAGLLRFPLHIIPFTTKYCFWGLHASQKVEIGS